MAAIKTKIIKNFFDKKELQILHKYCHNKLDEGNYVFDNHSFSPSFYNDPLMTAFLGTKLKKIEKICSLKLFPTYAYWRYYILGGSLTKHIDRPACEISVTACIKKEDNWPLIIEKQKIELKEGDALLYSGCSQEHGRPGIYKGEGMAQVFLHYVNQNGFYTHHAYDQYRKETGKNVCQTYLNRKNVKK